MSLLMSRVRATKNSTAQQTAKQSVNIDAIAERTAEQSRQRKQTAERKQTTKQSKATKQSEAKQTTKQSADERRKALAKQLSVIDTKSNKYDITFSAVADDYIQILRHSSHKTFCQIYCKVSYVLVLISRADVRDFTTDVEQLKEQKCYARYKVSYDSAVDFMKALTAYDTRKQTAQQSATKQTVEQSKAQ